MTTTFAFPCGDSFCYASCDTCRFPHHLRCSDGILCPDCLMVHSAKDACDPKHLDASDIAWRQKEHCNRTGLPWNQLQGRLIERRKALKESK